MYRKRKGISKYIFVLTTILIISFSAVGCSQKSIGVPENKSDTIDKPALDEISMPIVDEPLTLTYWVRSDNINNAASNYNDLLSYYEYEKLTGIHIDFIHPALGQDMEQFNLMVASNELPDIIEAYWIAMFPGGMEQAREENIIIDSTEYIDKWAPNLKSTINKDKEIEKQIKSDSGALYGFPWLQMERSAGIYFGSIVRSDWLKILGLKTPETIEDWDKMLTSFKENDPNGNGKKDEYGISFNYDDITYSAAFVSAWDIALDYYNDNGVVKYGYIEPAFKEFVKLFKDWYDRGLIDPDFATHSTSTTAAKVTSSKAGSWLGWGSNLREFPIVMQQTYPDAEVMPVMNPVLKTGQQMNFGQCDNTVTPCFACLTTVNKHIPESIQWLDYKYSEKGSMLFNFGVEGVTYNMVDGQPVYTDLIMKNPDGKSIREALDSYLCVSPGPYMSDPRYVQQIRKDNPAAKATEVTWGGSTFSKNMPPITITVSETEQLSLNLTEIETYSKEMFLKFVTGQQPLEEIDAFVTQLKDMGVEDIIAIKQAALDRYNSR